MDCFLNLKRLWKYFWAASLTVLSWRLLGGWQEENNESVYLFYAKDESELIIDKGMHVFGPRGKSVLYMVYSEWVEQSLGELTHRSCDIRQFPSIIYLEEILWGLRSVQELSYYIVFWGEEDSVVISGEIMLLLSLVSYVLMGVGTGWGILVCDNDSSIAIRC